MTSKKFEQVKYIMETDFVYRLSYLADVNSTKLGSGVCDSGFLSTDVLINLAKDPDTLAVIPLYYEFMQYFNSRMGIIENMRKASSSSLEEPDKLIASVILTTFKIQEGKTPSMYFIDNYLSKIEITD